MLETNARQVAKRTQVLLVLVLAMVGCEAAPAAIPAGEGYADPGSPLPGLTDVELSRFAQGRDLFFHEFTPAEGLGPLYNQLRCSSCHDLPSLGGYGAESVMKVTHWDGRECDLLQLQGGDVIQARMTPELAAAGGEYEGVPVEATERADILPPGLWGLGLVEAIPDSEILSREDPDDRDGDGISGRAGRSPDGRLGRFGRRAETVTIRDFVEKALTVEMSLTTLRYPSEQQANARPVPPAADLAADPEVSDSMVSLLEDFTRFLAVPARFAGTGAAADSVSRGETLFAQIGCTACHTPVMRTGESDVPALSDRAVALWSDLLVHDLGAAVASVCGPGSSPSEFRTAPLMGLRLRGPLMNDGRAANIASAIQMHGGEATRSQRAFDALSPADQAAVLRFLRSL